MSRTGTKMVSAAAAPGYSRRCATTLVKQNVFSLFPDEYTAICRVLEDFVAFAESETKMSDTVQRITIDGLELVAHGDVQWEKEQENEFTLRLGETENELAEVSLKKIVRLRLVRKESLVLPPSDDEAAWAKNAI